jgi:circadian clock protein KaiB
MFKFRLYVAGNTPNSMQAFANLTALCHGQMPDRYEIEVVDVFRQPKRALADGILMTPTLLKLTPLPTRHIVGTLSQTRLVMQVLGLDPGAP